jgi:hypothetical protein
LPIKRGLNLLEACHLVRQNQAQIKIKVLLGMTVMCWFLLALPFLTILRPIADRIQTASCTYIHVLSLCHLYPLPFTWRIKNENFQKILFWHNSSHNFPPTKRNELRYHCCLSQLYFIGH